MTNANRAVFFSIIVLCLISLAYRFFPREIISPKTTVHLDLYEFQSSYQEENDVLQTLIAQFEAENPDIVVVPLYHSYQDVMQKLFEPVMKDEETDNKQIQSDLVMIDMDWLPNLLQTKMLEPLAAFPKTDSDVRMLYETSKIGGATQAIPLFSNPYLFFYNIDLLKAAGFDRPPKTRDELLRYGRILQEKQSAAIGLALSAENHSGMVSDIFSWFWTSGIAFTNDEHEPQFSAKPAIESLQFLDALHRGNLISPDIFNKTEAAKIDDFCGGKTAMMIASLSMLPEIQNRADFEWGLSSIPTAASYIGSPFFVTERSGMGIYSASEHKEEAWMFLAFLAGAKQNAALASAYYCLPENQNAQTFAAKDSPQIEKAFTLLNSGKEIHEFHTKPGIFTAEKIIREELQKMMSGGHLPDDLSLGENLPGDFSQFTAEAIQERWAAEF